MTSTAMKTRPILFGGEMVRAILAGKKTVTRRIIKGAPLDPASYVLGVHKGIWRIHPDVDRDDAVPFRRKCPYGVRGDRLWVRETWASMQEYRPIANPERYDEKRAWYKADNDRPMWAGSKWEPSIFMPREYSRITLEVTDVRVERLHQITASDARAEGCDPDWDLFEDHTSCQEGWDEPEEFVEECEDECDWVNFGRGLVHSREHKEWLRDREDLAVKLTFKSLWRRINGDDSWDRNPWVWVVSFTRCS